MFHLRLVTFFLFFLAICNIAKSDTVAVSEDKTQSSDTSVQQNIDTDEVTLTVSGNAQVDDDVQAVLVDSDVSGAGVIVESGSTITTTTGDNGIIAINTTLLDVTNSGTISAADDKAIDIYLIIIVLQKLHYFFCMKYEGKSRKNKLFNNSNILYIFQN